MKKPKRFSKLTQDKRKLIFMCTISVLIVTCSSSAIYTHSGGYQNNIHPTATPIIIVKKAAEASKKEPSETTVIPSDTSTSTVAPAQLTPTSGTTPKKQASSSSDFQTIACNDKLNSIYYNYNMSLAAENQHHKDELESIQSAYDFGIYEQLAEQLADGTTAEQLRDESISEENARWNAATIQLAADEQSQMQASGCFGAH